MRTFLIHCETSTTGVERIVVVEAEDWRKAELKAEAWWRINVNPYATIVRELDADDPAHKIYGRV